jgi:hypothetical protein
MNHHFNLPYAMIAVNGEIINHLNDKFVYLKDRTHFQIILFNPTQTKISWKAWIDGSLVKSKDVEILPGETINITPSNKKGFLFKDGKFPYLINKFTEILIASSKINVEFYSNNEIKPDCKSHVWTYSTVTTSGMLSYAGTTVNQETINVNEIVSKSEIFIGVKENTITSCEDCGKKTKSKWNFCPSCGSNLDK